jgi:hypothetical protein
VYVPSKVCAPNSLGAMKEYSMNAKQKSDKDVEIQ